MHTGRKEQEPALVTDADNTLWDTDAIFANAQLALLARLEVTLGQHAPHTDRLSLIREVDQNLATEHHQHLRYPPRLLIFALVSVLSGTSPKQAARRAVRGLLTTPGHIDPDVCAQWFIDQIRKEIPELRIGVPPGLRQLRDDGVSVVVTTEGPEDKCRKLIEHHKLSGFIDKIVSAPKTVQLFQRIARLMGRREDVCFMVGDQLDRDVAPAKQAAYHTIYFPGGFKPYWTPEEVSVAPEYRISSFEELPSIIRRFALSQQSDGRVWRSKG